MAVQGTIKKPAPSSRLQVGRLSALLLCREDPLQGCTELLGDCFALGVTLTPTPDNCWIPGGFSVSRAMFLTRKQLTQFQSSASAHHALWPLAGLEADGLPLNETPPQSRRTQGTEMGGSTAPSPKPLCCITGPAPTAAAQHPAAFPRSDVPRTSTTHPTQLLSPGQAFRAFAM